MSDVLTDEKKQEYERQLEAISVNKKCRKMYSRAKCDEMIEIIKSNRNNNHKKEPLVYFILENFNVFHIGGKDHLIAKDPESKKEAKM